MESVEPELGNWMKEVGFELDLVNGDDLLVVILTWWLPKETHRGEWLCICQILTSEAAYLRHLTGGGGGRGSDGSGTY